MIYTFRRVMSELLLDTQTAFGIGLDERAARAELRRQIGRLEQRLAALSREAFQRVELDLSVQARSATPRALDLGRLEQVRDGLADRVAAAERALAERDELELENRELLERMLAAPADYKWLQISRDDLGLPGCGHWHSRPRFGLLGMLAGWWRVRISSGCPLAERLAAVEHEAQSR